ncbi:MAG: CHAT domain-containing protein [Balneolaceae bacterium]|nr:CHAT domain-containing protein [Balneolaceae bacterium]
MQRVIDWVKNSTDIQSGFWNIEPEYINAFQQYVDLLIGSNRHDEAVLTLDKLKTINDADLFQDPMVKSTQLNESELTQYRNLTSQLDQLRKQQLSTSGELSVELQSKIDRLNAQKRTLDRKISSYSDQPSIQHIQQIQHRLKPQDLVLHITGLENTYYIAQVTRRAIEIETVDLDQTTRNLFEQSIEGLATGSTDLNQLYEIGDILNISDLPIYAENIILIPDSYLFQLPMDIIPTTKPAHSYSYGGTSYIIEEYQTEYLTSLNELVYSSEAERSFTWDYVGFGISTFEDSKSDLMPLPYASTEVNLISDALQNFDQRRTLVEEQSTETAFRQMAPDTRILHLATHSTVSESDPLFSTIYMSAPGDSTEQEQFSNQIFAYELFEMNLNNELIMLNSCESGSGSYLQGSGIVGISRALRFAGAQSLVLNLWSVNDMMASDFAVQFYTSLNDGDSKSEALRKAKVHFLKQKNANPHYWGPYMLIGSSRPVIEPYKSSNSIFAAGFMAYLILMAGLSYATQRKG